MEKEKQIDFKNPHLRATSSTEVAETDLICHLLKMTNSIQAVLIPWDDFELDWKAFTWTITSFDTDGFKIKFDFEEPTSISQNGRPDVMKISFENTNLFMLT